jgi:phosphate:Na+ symporter
VNVAWFELAYNVIGGLAVFLFGMKALSEALQALASDFIRKVIGWLTANRFLAIAVGTVVTLIVQSSSVTTVMVVGFVNAGLMSLPQAVGVVLGANIGTTITGWIVALKIGKYGLVFLAAGLAPYFFAKNPKWQGVGKMLSALGFIFLGLGFMSGGFKPLTRDPQFADLLTWFAADSTLSVLACVTVGCLLTFLVQSSSAMLAITIALATTGSEGNPPVIGLATADFAPYSFSLDSWLNIPGPERS